MNSDKGHRSITFPATVPTTTGIKTGNIGIFVVNAHSGMRGETSPMYFHGMTTLTPRTLRLSWGFTYQPSPMVCGIDTPKGFISSGRMHYYVKDYQGNVRQVTDADGVVEQNNHYYPIKYLIHYE